MNPSTLCHRLRFYAIFFSHLFYFFFHPEWQTAAALDSVETISEFLFSHRLTHKKKWETESEVKRGKLLHNVGGPRGERNCKEAANCGATETNGSVYMRTIIAHREKKNYTNLFSPTYLLWVSRWVSFFSSLLLSSLDAALSNHVIWTYSTSYRLVFSAKEREWSRKVMQPVESDWNFLATSDGRDD